MNIIKSSLSGLILVLLGELVGTNLVSAQEVPIHDTSIVPVTQSLVDAAGANPGATANFDSETGAFNVDGLGEGLALSPDVIQSLESLQGAANGSSPGDLGSGDLGSGDSGSGNSGSGGVLNNISVNDLAKLVQTDLQDSMDSLVAAESAEQQQQQEPRRFARRRSDCNSSCVVGTDGEPQNIAQLEAEVAQKTAEAEKFVQQLNQLDPENSIW